MGGMVGFERAQNFCRPSRSRTPYFRLALFAVVWDSSLLGSRWLKTKIGNSCAPEAVLVQRFRMTWVRMILHAAEEVTLPELPSVSVKKAKPSMHMYMDGESPIGQVSFFAIMWTLAGHF